MHLRILSCEVCRSAVDAQESPGIPHPLRVPVEKGVNQEVEPYKREDEEADDNRTHKKFQVEY